MGGSLRSRGRDLLMGPLEIGVEGLGSGSHDCGEVLW